MIEFFEDGRLELYHLKADISEEHDISSQYPQITQRLQKSLHEWRERIHAKIPAENPEYSP